MIKKIKTFKEVPYIEDKVYKTKFQTGDMFQLKKVVQNKDGKIIRFDGIYVKSPHLGICPIGADRLVNDTIEVSEIEVCSKCGEPIHG